MSIIQSEKSLDRQYQRLKQLLSELKSTSLVEERIEILNALPEVDGFFSFPSPLKTFLTGLSLECEYVIKALFAIGQGLRIFEGVERVPTSRLRALFEDLLAIEMFYKEIGGVIGYHFLVLSLLTQKGKSFSGELQPPRGVDLTEDTLEVRKAILEGIKNQGKMAELYPVGGAADRLQLKDETTEEGLPAARLIFLGKPLLEGVISDLQAREYLHYKLFGKQVTTPIGMMTSHVHRNHDHIQDICKGEEWFGRLKDHFHFVTQPSVPTFTKEGNWCLQKPLKLLLKPGGHGMLWKLLRQNGVFQAFEKQGAKKALVRQINNPIAGTDYGLLAFLGVGHLQDKAFGFASCPRLVNAQEGMNVIEEKGEGIALTNIEYCDFEKRGIEDIPVKGSEKFSRFPSNTNILFADLKVVEEASKKLPNPGLLVNFRKKEGEEATARLETTMQNIADALTVPKGEEPATYLTNYERRKTISTTKRKSTEKGAMLETPEGCYYDYMLNAKELLQRHCKMTLPIFPSEEIFRRAGPSFIFSAHPALGPLFSVMGQKLRGGTITEGSELQLEIADLDCENLFLQGSLLIYANHLMGHKEKGILRYSNQTGRCVLKNVRVENEGIDWEEDHLFWKHEVNRNAALKIVLHGASSFRAENVTLEGNQTIEVPDGYEVIAKEENGKLILEKRPFEVKGPFWSYTVSKDNRIQLALRD